MMYGCPVAGLQYGLQWIVSRYHVGVSQELGVYGRTTAARI
jgi:hypothetical protein